MTSPNDRLPISITTTTTATKMRSVSTSSSLRINESGDGGSGVSDDVIWEKLREAGFDEDSIKRRDKALLIAYITKIETEIFEYQHQMGLLLMERRDWTSKFDQLKALTDSAEMTYKLGQAAHLSELAEVKKREESLKRALGIEKECIKNIEKTLHEMRAESAETKIAVESKMDEARVMLRNAQEKFTEAEAKLSAAESLQAEVSRHDRATERRLQDLEEREDELRRRLLTFKAECDAKEKELSIEKQNLCDRRNSVQQEQEILLEGQILLNQREEYISCRCQELLRLEKELENSKVNIEEELSILNEEKSKLALNLANLSTREEILNEKELLFEKREQELHSEHEKRVCKEYEKIRVLRAELETTTERRKAELEAEMAHKHKIIDNELDVKRRSCELREVDIRQREEAVREREHDLELLSVVLGEKEKDLSDRLKAVEEKNENLHTIEKATELEKMNMEKIKKEVRNLNMDVQKSMTSLENKRKEVEEAQKKLEASKLEKEELLALEVNLKEEIDSIRAHKYELLAEAEALKVEKSKFEAEWEVIDEKRDDLKREARHVYEERKAVSQFLKEERDSLKLEKDTLRDQFKRDCEELAAEREAFVSKMEQERSELFSRIQHERDNFVQDIELQKRELENCINKRRDEIESYLMEKEEAFEQEKTKEHQYISSLKEMVTQEREYVASEMKRLEKERMDMVLDRECREKEQESLQKLVDELQIQEEKLKEQRKLLHADREKISSQIIVLNKLEDLKTASEAISLSKLQESNVKSTRCVKRYTSTPSTQKDGELDLYAQKNGHSDFVGLKMFSKQAQDSASPLSPAPLSWFKRIFKTPQTTNNFGERLNTADFEGAKLLEDKYPLHDQTIRYPLMQNLESLEHSYQENGLLTGKKRLNTSLSPDCFESPSNQNDGSKKRKQEIEVVQTPVEKTTTNRVVSTTVVVEDETRVISYNLIPENPEPLDNLANGNHE